MGFAKGTPFAGHRHVMLESHQAPFTRITLCHPEASGERIPLRPVTAITTIMQTSSKTTIQIDKATRNALGELQWRYRTYSLNAVIDLLINEAEPEVYHEYISEDDPEE